MKGINGVMNNNYDGIFLCLVVFDNNILFFGFGVRRRMLILIGVEKKYFCKMNFLFLIKIGFVFIMGIDCINDFVFYKCIKFVFIS